MRTRRRGPRRRFGRRPVRRLGRRLRGNPPPRASRSNPSGWSFRSRTRRGARRSLWFAFAEVGPNARGIGEGVSREPVRRRVRSCQPRGIVPRRRVRHRSRGRLSRRRTEGNAPPRLPLRRRRRRRRAIQSTLARRRVPRGEDPRRPRLGRGQREGQLASDTARRRGQIATPARRKAQRSRGTRRTCRAPRAREPPRKLRRGAPRGASRTRRRRTCASRSWGSARAVLGRPRNEPTATSRSRGLDDDRRLLWNFLLIYKYTPLPGRGRHALFTTSSRFAPVRDDPPMPTVRARGSPSSSRECPPPSPPEQPARKFPS